MKQTRLVKLLAACAAGAVALGAAFAQETSTTTTTTAGTTGVSESTTSTSTLSGSGTITAYIMFRTESSTTPVKYYYTKKTVLIDPEGRTVEWTALRPDMPVTYTYTKEGDRMVVSKVTLAKPLSYYETKETTTTTTKP